MQIPQLRMESEFAQIGIRTTPGKQEIAQPKAELTIEQPPADMQIRTVPGKLKIDQTKAWEDMDLMSILKRNEKFAQEGMQAAQEGTARRAEQGTELMKIEKGGNPLIDHAVNAAFKPQKRLGIKFIPSSFSVRIDYEPSRVDIQVQPNKPVIQATPQKVIHHYEPGHVEIYMQKYPSLKIETVNVQV